MACGRRVGDLFARSSTRPARHCARSYGRRWPCDTQQYRERSRARAVRRRRSDSPLTVTCVTTPPRSCRATCGRRRHLVLRPSAACRVLVTVADPPSLRAARPRGPVARRTGSACDTGGVSSTPAVTSDASARTGTPYPYEAPASAALFERARAVTPGGVNSPVRAFRAVGGTPRFMVRGEGPYLYDADGREYVDLVCSWGPMILGHAHPRRRRGRDARPRERASPSARRPRTRSLLAEEIVAPGGARRAGAAGQLGHRGDDERRPAGPRASPGGRPW